MLGGNRRAWGCPMIIENEIQKRRELLLEKRKHLKKVRKDIKKINIKEHKYCIVINSEEDNSIPYEVFDIIERKFEAMRIHLG
jgi:hypothetical protein